ncbi:hypothetical protein KIL84_010745, partial [Mauremys mutica]
KKLSRELNDVLCIIVKIVNLVKANGLNSHIFATMCEEMGSKYHHLLLYAEVQWLSHGKVLNRGYELQCELEVFLSQKKSPPAAYFQDLQWLAKPAYLADIFDHFNQLNLSMQESMLSVFVLADKLTTFKKKSTNS